MEGINEVRNWSWELPTEPGFYLACYGDLETHENTFPLFVDYEGSVVLSREGRLNKMENYKGWKFARLLFTGSELERLEGA